MIGRRDNGFPGPAVALDGPAEVVLVSMTNYYRPAATETRDICT